MVDVVVEKEDCLDMEEAVGVDEERNNEEVEVEGGTQRLLYPPATPRLAIFFSTCAIA
jgi:hypothetical protein